MNCLDGLFRTVGSVETVKNWLKKGTNHCYHNKQKILRNKNCVNKPINHFGDVFKDFVFLDTGGGKMEVQPNTKAQQFWIEDNPNNVRWWVAGLVALLLDPHNAGYNSDNEP